MLDRTHCPYCGGVSHIPGTHLKAEGSAVNTARCQQCEREWKVPDRQERRNGPSERRRVPRIDRRRGS
jgi:formate dehydrogenase maturation protein FdhE